MAVGRGDELFQLQFHLLLIRLLALGLGEHLPGGLVGLCLQNLVAEVSFLVELVGHGH